MLDLADAAWKGTDRMVSDGILQPGHDVIADAAVTPVKEGLDGVIDPG